MLKLPQLCGGFEMASITCTLSMQQIMELKKNCAFGELKSTPPYALFRIRMENCNITAYESGKVVFQGENPLQYCAPYHHEKKVQEISASFPQAGSDEVGTGDYFGPVCVCACMVAPLDLDFLKPFQIQDSKQLKDAYIKEIAPLLQARLPHSLLILNNRLYNQIHPTNNMVAIKSKLHNQAFVHLAKKLGKLPDLCVIDQFVQGSSYYRYIKDEAVIVDSLHFETKAENKYLAVACGAIIARYAFLKAFEKMCETYDFAFLKGAGSKVDENIRQFVKRFSIAELNNVAKIHFKNSEKAL